MVRREQPEPQNTEDYTIADFLQGDTAFMPSESEQPEFDPIEAFGTASVSITEIILPQLHSKLNEADIPIAEYIIENLDEDGFLIISEEEIINAFKIDKIKLKSYSPSNSTYRTWAGLLPKIPTKRFWFSWKFWATIKIV